jgi:hypothetical protein
MIVLSSNDSRPVLSTPHVGTFLVAAPGSPCVAGGGPG